MKTSSLPETNTPTPMPEVKDPISNKIKIPMADPMPEGCRQPKPVVIDISKSISDVKKEEHMEECNDLVMYDAFNKYYANKLADALLNALPQCLLEPLMVKLMESRISLYHGSMQNTKVLCENEKNRDVIQ